MAKKLLDLFPKPLLADLVAGRWLPVVGAGMSLNAKMPPGRKMPLWPALGEALAGDLSDFSPTGTLDAISAFQHEFGRSKLIERLIDILHINDAQPGRAHEAFCGLPFDIACTTNFDFLLERQYERGLSHAYTVVDEEQLSINGSPSGTLLLKLHGDLHHPSRLVVTEEDYDGFLNRYPLIATYLANLLITKTAVFIGYSLDDPDFRQIWSIVHSRLGSSRRMAYSIMVDAGPSEIARYERRGVKVVNLPGPKSRYGDTLAEAFEELHAHWRDNVISASKVTEEEPLRELMLPRDASSRLCFFSIPVDRLALYRSEVFPYVQSLGFVPVTADDVISPGDSFIAKIDALIDRAAVIVSEPATDRTRAELHMALGRRGSEQRDANRFRRVIIVDSKFNLPDESAPYGIQYMVISRDELTDNPEQFGNKLTKILSTFAEELGLGFDTEPARLLEQGEARAAVISAMTLLEIRLREQFSFSNQSTSSSHFTINYRPETLRTLIDNAATHGVISDYQRNHAHRWMKLRNEIVHIGRIIPMSRAREIVNGVSEIVHEIQKYGQR